MGRLNREQLEGLLSYCADDSQRLKVMAVIEHGSHTAAAEALGLNQSTLTRSIQVIQRRAAAQGYAPECGIQDALAEGFTMSRGYSAMGLRPVVDPVTGEARSLPVWYKATKTQESFAAQLEQVVESLAARVEGIAQPVRQALGGDDELQNLIPIGDHHLGMYAWSKETGSDSYDLEIAEQILEVATRYLLQTAPPADTCVIAPLGDFFHYETKDARSLNSGHSYDSDGRFSKMIDVGVQVIRTAIDEALLRHREVQVVVTLGNHDWHPSLALEKILAAYYCQEPRVRIIEGHGRLFHFLRWGSVLHGFHHGHTKAVDRLGGLMPRLEPDMWGATRHRYWHTGHIHKDRLVPLSDGSIAASYGVLCPPDAYNAGAAHLQVPRGLQRRTYHKRYGDIMSAHIPVDLANALSTEA